MAEAERDAVLAAQPAARRVSRKDVAQLQGCRSRAPALLWLEALFRHFDNRRQVAACAGLCQRSAKGIIDRGKAFQRRE